MAGIVGKLILCVTSIMTPCALVVNSASSLRVKDNVRYYDSEDHSPNFHCLDC